MTRRNWLSVCTAVAWVSTIGTLPAAPVGPKIEVMARDRPSSVTAINISAIEQLPGPVKIDQIVAQLPADKPVTNTYLPDGWSFNQQGNRIRLNGPAMSGVYVRLDLNGSYLKDYVGKDATIQYGLGGKLDSIKVNIGSGPAVSPTPDLEGILTIPPRGVPGKPMLIGVADPYRQGKWEIGTTGGGAMPLLPLDQIRDVEIIKGAPQSMYDTRGATLNKLLSRPGSQPFMTSFPETGSFTNVRYIDPFGELLVDAPINIMPAMPATGPRRLTSGSTFALAGQAACVAGSFPTFEDPFGLRLDGMIELPVWGASQTAVMLGIPEGTSPGPHTISDASGSSSITIGVLTIKGSLDENKLWKGESTVMRLQVLGTDKPVPLGILNRSPAIISIAGGVKQPVSTSGGATNAVTRDVKGIQRGNFTIVYSVNASGCGTP